MAGDGQGCNFFSMQTGGEFTKIAELLLMTHTGQVKPPALSQRLDPLFNTLIKAIALCQARLDLVVYIRRHGQRTVELTEHVNLTALRADF
jgi:hypothetical protein